MKPDIGIPHFTGILKQARASQYNFIRSINDIIDNVIYLCSLMFINIIYDFETNNIDCIEFIDNYEKGFENLQFDGSENPFNMAHIKISHDNDLQTSEFGMGLKYASIFLGNELVVYTRIYDKDDGSIKYYKIRFDFNKMGNQNDALKSYEAQEWYPISKEEYLQNHNNIDCGSTIRINKIRKEAYTKKDNEDFLSNIRTEINNAYSDVINTTNISVSVNDIKLDNVTNYLSHENSKDLVVSSKINLVNDINNFKAVQKTKYYTDSNEVYYKHDNNHHENISKEEYESFIKENETLDMTFKSTTTYFIHDSNNEDRDKKLHETNMTNGLVNIYRNKRKYDSISYINGGRRNNGSQNYTYHRIDYISKKINKLIGMNYNKNINTGLSNDFTDMLGYIQKLHEGKFSSDKTNKVFKKMEENAIKKNITNIKRYKEKSDTPTPTPVLPTPTPVLPTLDPDPPTPTPVLPAPTPVLPTQNPDPPKNVYNQDPTIYWGIFKIDKNSREIELDENNKIKGKIGFTCQSPTKRDQGPPYGIIGSNWERQNTYPINDYALEKVTNIYDQQKIKLEVEIYNELIMNNIVFEENSTEVFFFSPREMYNIIDIIYKTASKYRIN